MFVSEKIFVKWSEHIYIMEFKYRSEAKQVNIELWIQQSVANEVISKNQIREAKRTYLILK
jgi:hypothetical protein